MKPIKVTEPIVLQDGQHDGVIINVEPRVFTKGNEDITYCDITIESENTRIKASYSAVISRGSMLGKLLGRFGTELIKDDELDPEAILIGATVVFQTVTTENKGVQYAEILRETLKPKE